MGEDEEKKGGVNRKIVLVFVIAVVAFIVGMYLNKPSEPGYRFFDEVAGVPVKSEIPVAELENWTDLGLFETQDAAVLSCNLELSSITPKAEERLYWVLVERGKMGIEVRQVDAFVRGQSDAELLTACHAFACLLGGISCPENLEKIRNTVAFEDDINIILDSEVSGEGGRAYAELLAPIGFMQTQQADLNKNRVIEPEEVGLNRMVIRPYIREGDLCTPQPLRTLLQNISGGNTSMPCNLSSGFFIEEADTNEITADGNRVHLRGDAKRLQIEAIIVGDIIAPQWITAFRGL